VSSKAEKVTHEAPAASGKKYICFVEEIVFSCKTQLAERGSVYGIRPRREVAGVVFLGRGVSMSSANWLRN
jgi:hypothetical protein